MIKKHSIDKKIILACLGIILVSSTIFIYTVLIRHEWFGNYTENDHEWLTGSTLKFSGNWYREGPWNIKFGMLENPRSPEFTNLWSRGYYISYPPGAVVPVYLLSVLINKEPSVSLVMAYNLLNHLLISIILGLTVFFFIRSLKLDLYIAFFFSLAPVLLQLLMPEPMYFHQNSFFADQAVILPFVLVIFIEVMRDNFEGKKRRYLDILQALVFFSGILTEWLFIFVIAFIYIKRLISGEFPFDRKAGLIKQSLVYFTAPGIAILLFLLQILWIFDANIGKAIEGYANLFRVRVGVGAVNETSTGAYLEMISGHISNGYGRPGFWLISASALFVIAGTAYLLGAKIFSKAIQPEIRKIILLALIIVGPCLTQIYLFKNHSAVHSFSVLKLSVVLSMVPFVLLPLFLAFLITKFVNVNTQKIMEIMLVPVLVVFGFYVVNTHPQFRDFFDQNDPRNYDFAAAVKRNTNANDVVFSPDMEIPENAPQQLSISMKRVYVAESLLGTLSQIENIEGDYRVVWVFEQKQDSSSHMRETTLPVEAYQEDGRYVFVRLNPGELKDYFQR